MENLMVVLLIGGACLALVALCQLLESYNNSLDSQIEEKEDETIS